MRSAGFMTGKIKNLEALRGFLALCVVIHHIPQVSDAVGLPSFAELPILQKGHDSVLIFFSLSGYLIVGLLYDEKRKYGYVNIKHFYIRRILRLYPVYYFVLLFGFVYYHYLLPEFNIPFETNYNLIEGILWNIGFLPNVFKGLYEPGGILIILWSIGIEEQFYLLVAPLLSVLPIGKYSRYLLLFSIVYFALYHIDFLSFLSKYRFLYFFMSTGGLLAILFRTGFRIHFRSFSLRLCLYAIFVLHFTTDLFQSPLPVVENAFELILFNLLIVNLANDDRISINSFLPNYLGRISYGIYMYHMIVVNFVLFIFLILKDVTDLNGWVTILLINITTVLGTIIASHISFKYFESYFLRLKLKYRK